MSLMSEVNLGAIRKPSLTRVRLAFSVAVCSLGPGPYLLAPLYAAPTSASYCPGIRYGNTSKTNAASFSVATDVEIFTSMASPLCWSDYA